MVMPKILIGCDPELFLREKVTGMAVSAWGKIPGTKEAPHPVKGGAIQVDGNAVEFNINPAENRDQWNENIATVLEELKAAIPGDTELVTQPVMDFDPEYFASLPEEARVLGCTPDYSAYTGQENPRPDGNPPFRTASGHIHIGWTKDKKEGDPDHMLDCIEVVKQLDFYLGVPSLMWDKDKRRRSLYGRAGACRFKPYGVEYRTPSNMWLTDPACQNFMYDGAIAAVTDLFEGRAMRVNYGPEWAKNYIDDDGRGRKLISRDVFSAISNGSKHLQDAGLLRLYDHITRKERAAAPKPAPIQVNVNAADLAVAGRRADMAVVDEVVAGGGWGEMQFRPAPMPVAPPPLRVRRAPQFGVGHDRMAEQALAFRGVPLDQMNRMQVNEFRHWAMHEGNFPVRGLAAIERRADILDREVMDNLPNEVPAHMRG